MEADRDVTLRKRKLGVEPCVKVINRPASVD